MGGDSIQYLIISALSLIRGNFGNIELFRWYGVKKIIFLHKIKSKKSKIKKRRKKLYNFYKYQHAK